MALMVEGQHLMRALMMDCKPQALVRTNVLPDFWRPIVGCVYTGVCTYIVDGVDKIIMYYVHTYACTH